MTKFLDASAYRLGGTAVDKVYAGSSLVYDANAGGGGGAVFEYEQHTRSLFHFDGQPGATSFADYGPAALSFLIGNESNATPTSALSSTKPKFGPTGITLNNGDFFSANAGDISQLSIGATDDFCVEYWGAAASGDVAGHFGSNAGSGWRVRHDGNGGSTFFRWQRVSGGVATTLASIMYSPIPELGQFVNTKDQAGTLQHFAVTRENGQLRIFRNGTLAAGPVADTNEYGGLEGFRVGPADAYVDEMRVSIGAAGSGAARYTANFTPQTEQHEGGGPPLLVVVSDLPANTTAYGGAVTLSVSLLVNDPHVVSYQWQKREAGAGSFVNISGATSASLSLESLTDADDTGDTYRVVASSGSASFVSVQTTLTVDESGINADNRFRVTAAATTTSLVAAVDSTTGYWKMVASTGQESPVIGSQWSQYSPYYFNTGTVSGMPSGVEKVIEVYSCDASGAPSGELEYVSFAPSTQAITTVDASGCATLRGFNVSSSSTPYQSWSGVSQMPSSIVLIRAVGVAGSGGSYSQWGPYPANVSEGINVAGQLLSGAALNQLYTDLGNATNASLFVAQNPGTEADDPTIATAKGYTVFGS